MGANRTVGCRKLRVILSESDGRPKGSRRLLSRWVRVAKVEFRRLSLKHCSERKTTDPAPHRVSLAGDVTPLKLPNPIQKLVFANLSSCRESIIRCQWTSPGSVQPGVFRTKLLTSRRRYFIHFRLTIPID